MSTNGHITKNYMAHGGEELIIGGKLTFLAGAVVEGAEGLLDIPKADAPYVADSTATTVAALRDNYNALLAALRNAGVLATAQSSEVSAGDPDS